jgi:hypothetical protein
LRVRPLHGNWHIFGIFGGKFSGKNFWEGEGCSGEQLVFYMRIFRPLWKETAFHIGQHTSHFVWGGIGFYAVSSPGDDLDVGGYVAFGVVDSVQGG